MSRLLSHLDLSDPTVSLSNTDLSLPLLKELCGALLRLDNVTRLDLSHNDIGEAGAEVLAEFLHEKPQIHHLTLKACNIGDTGLALMCRSLSRHATVRTLVLGKNPISDVGLSELGAFLTRSVDIEELDLLDTPITLHGTLAFADMLVRNESLLRLRLPHVLGHRVLREVDRLLRRNWMRRNNVDERRAAWDAERDSEMMADARLQEQWRVHQPKAKPPPPASGFTMEEWSDPDLAPTLMYLEILDRKTKLNNSNSNKRSSSSNNNNTRNNNGTSASGSGRRSVKTTKEWAPPGPEPFTTSGRPYYPQKKLSLTPRARGGAPMATSSRSPVMTVPTQQAPQQSARWAMPESTVPRLPSIGTGGGGRMF